MTRTEIKLKGLVRKAVQVKQDHTTLSILPSMRVAKFTNEESEDYTLQAQVRHMVSPLTKQINVAKTPTSLTVSMPTHMPPDKLHAIKKIRRVSMQTQQKLSMILLCK